MCLCCSCRQELVRLINSNQVLVVSGETGCGKTTQVTQFILDDHINRGLGSVCRVICTQPRRISAISVRRKPASLCSASVHWSVLFHVPEFMYICVFFFSVFFRLQSVWRLREQKVSGTEILAVTRFVCRGMGVSLLCWMMQTWHFTAANHQVVY